MDTIRAKEGFSNRHRYELSFFTSPDACHCYAVSMFNVLAISFSAAIDTIRANESLRETEALVSNGNRFKLSVICFVSDSPGTLYQTLILSNSSVLLYVLLNSSGSVEQMVWSDEKKRWDVTWSSTSNECDMYAYAYPPGIGCLQWTQKYTYGGDDLHIRLTHSEIAEKKQYRKAIIVTAVVLGFILVAICVYFLLKYLCYRGYSVESTLKHDEHGVILEELPTFGFMILSNATENFNPANKLGRGGFGLVYKGKLPNGVEIAVKRLARSSNQGVEEFMNEVQLGYLSVCGYMPPEYALRGIFSEKSDVYGFGVLLLEIVSGKKHSSFYDQQLFLTAYAWKLWNDGQIVYLVDPAIYDAGIEDDMMRYANIGLLCVQEIAADRPNTLTVLSMLSCEIVVLPHPKQPAFLAMQSSQSTEPSSKSISKCSAWKLWNEGKKMNLMDADIFDSGMEDDIVRYANVSLLCVQDTAADRPNNMSRVLRCLAVRSWSFLDQSSQRFVGCIVLNPRSPLPRGQLRFCK
ncbi:G-type lectin S-receptor-like serine/threonine-protein kinase SD1-13 [Salvia splendens]|uniref:G-type lectin S-receptor-like serine/threonine-protein kinase SD1-13 n=1 Tax=Salvia splendens TaxID=180675 RepID=UPI001C273FCF|nr:G-type lectin S-receptor-like serine/threonine-protein kinase SD1-13 [Salvia splendens]